MPNENENSEQRIKDLEGQLKKQRTSFRNFGQEMADAFSNAFGQAGETVDSMGSVMETRLSSVRDITRDIERANKRIAGFYNKQTKAQSEVAGLNEKAAILDKKRNDFLKKIKDSGKAITKEDIKKIHTLKEQSNKFKDQAKTLGNLHKLSELRHKQIKGMSGALTAMAKIPIVGRLMDAQKASKKMKEHIDEGGTAMGAMAKGFGSMIQSAIMAAPAAFVGAAVKQFFALDDAITQTSKTLGVSYDDALAYQQQLYQSSTDARHNTEDMLASINMLAKETGVVRDIHDEDLQTITEISQAGQLDVKSQAKLVQFAGIQNKSVKDTYKQILGTVLLLT